MAGLGSLVFWTLQVFFLSSISAETYTASPGGLTIHTTSGVAALVVTIMLEARTKLKKLKAEGHAHNIPLTVVGMSLIYAGTPYLDFFSHLILLSGWYSFNGGSAFKADFNACVALFNTQISACTALVTWSVMSFILTRSVPLTGAMSGVLAGLAGVTPGITHRIPKENSF